MSSRKLIICGESESGKTTLAAALAATIAAEAGGKRIVAVNDQTASTRWDKIPWSDVNDSLKNVVVVVEDLLACKESEFKRVLYLLAFSGHHRAVDTVIICHAMKRSNVQGLLKHVDQVIFTLSRTGSECLKIVLKKYNFPDIDVHLSSFEDAKGKFGHFIVDRKLRVFKRGDVAAAAATATAAEAPPRSKEDFLVTAKSLLGELDNAKRGLAIFNLLLAKLPLDCICPDDLSITLYDKTTELPMTYNLVEYIHVLLTKDVSPSRDVQRFNKFVRARVNIANFLVANKVLRKP
jgi:energy-coupling factor transporter ATP-binding protein EcfA2